MEWFLLLMHDANLRDGRGHAFERIQGPAVVGYQEFEFQVSRSLEKYAS